PQIPCPRAVAIASDGSVLVTNESNKTLHMLSSRGSWIKQLWSVPSGRDQQGALYAISMDRNVCACITTNGSVYLLDYSFQIYNTSSSKLEEQIKNECVNYAESAC
ncbi:hypothetical protein PoB_002449500, partial [Plakobranchus ocellatus]